MYSIDFKTEEVQYLLSIVLTRYHQVKKNEQDIYDNEISESIKKELSILMALYNKIESINSFIKGDNS